MDVFNSAALFTSKDEMILFFQQTSLRAVAQRCDKTDCH
jgi:hypothetical protein